MWTETGFRLGRHFLKEIIAVNKHNRAGSGRSTSAISWQLTTPNLFFVEIRKEWHVAAWKDEIRDGVDVEEPE